MKNFGKASSNKEKLFNSLVIIGSIFVVFEIVLFIIGCVLPKQIDLITLIMEAIGIFVLLIGVILAFFLKGVFLVLAQDKAKVPGWEEILDYLYENELEWFEEEVKKVIYSKDRSRRFLVLRNMSGIYKIALQQVVMDRYPYPDDPYPAHWEFVAGWDMRSFYSSEKDAMDGIINSTEYKNFFMSNNIEKAAP